MPIPLILMAIGAAGIFISEFLKAPNDAPPLPPGDSGSPTKEIPKLTEDVVSYDNIDTLLTSKIYSIGFVGTRNSGKTVYLAALHHRLATQDDDLGFYLKLPSSQRRSLVTSFSRLNSQHRWPAPNFADEIAEWIFTLAVQKDGATYDACQFRYYDYAGGLLTEKSDDPQEPAVEAKFAECDALIGLLDGVKLSHYVRGLRSQLADEFVDIDLKNAISAMQDIPHGERVKTRNVYQSPT